MGDGQRRADQKRGRGQGLWIILVVLLLLLVAGGVGYLVGRGNAPEPGSALPTQTGTTTPTQTSSTPSTSPSPAGGLVDGRYFIYPKKVKGGSVTFDVARFLTGKAAADAAKAHGDESPPPNDYYIVNDSKALSTYPVSTSVVVRYVPATNCCNLQVGDFSAWAAAVNGTVMTDYAGKNAPWWITITGGQIQKIQQQFLP
jgi:hypothetical protein